MTTKTFLIARNDGDSFSLLFDEVANLRDKDRILTWRKRLTVELDYPLRTTFSFPVTRKAGARAFTRASLAKEIQRLYCEVYSFDEAGNDKYGIWGHDMGDLVLEAITITPKGVVRLGIGS